jgi:glutamate/aspartate transport system permease protein
MSANLIQLLAEGLWLNLILTVVSLIGGVAIGIVLAVLRLSKSRVLSNLAKGYINVFRSVPLVLVLFWFYVLVPVLTGRPVGALPSAFVAFTMFEAAYFAEILRAGINSVGRNQFNAGLSVGMKPWGVWRYVVLPQAFRNTIPLILTQAIILFQDTSLVYVLGLRDFLTAADSIAQRDGNMVMMYGTAAAVFFVICTTAGAIVERLKKRLTL